jgi:hypothetical protein
MVQRATLVVCLAGTVMVLISAVRMARRAGRPGINRNQLRTREFVLEMARQQWNDTGELGKHIEAQYPKSEAPKCLRRNHCKGYVPSLNKCWQRGQRSELV